MATASKWTPLREIDQAATLDAVTEAGLRAAGSLKWTTFPNQLPAWVAEMDFKVAGPIAQRLSEWVSTAQLGYLPGHLVKSLGQVWAGAGTGPMMRAETSWELDCDTLAATLATGDILVLCNPHNPVGKVYNRQELLKLSAVVEVSGARVFSDEIHAPLLYDGATHVPYASVSDAAACHAVTATSASKAWNLAGTKAAQIIFSNPEDDQG